MKTRHRITAFAAIGAVIVALIAFAALAPVRVNSESIHDVHFEAAVLSEQMASRAQEAGRLAAVYVVSGRYEDQLAFEAAAGRFERATADYGDSPGSLGRSEGVYTERIQASWTDVRAAVRGRTVGLNGALDRMAVPLDELAEHELVEAADAMDVLNASIARAQIVIVALAIVMIAALIGAGIVASRSVARPLAILDVAVKRLADGELDQEIPQVGRDEIGVLAAAFEIGRVNLRAALSSLHDRIEEQTATEEVLAEANSELQSLLERARRSGNEMDLAGEMDALLQADLSWSEAYAVIANYGQQLFAGFQGALYLFDGDGPVLARAVEWGNAEPLAERYDVDECWSLRTAHAHWTRFNEPDLPSCDHVHAAGACSACVPLVAHGERLGTIVLVGCSGSDPCAEPGSYEHGRAILASFAGRVALAISNMQLRETLREQALRDPLTGLYNRRPMEEGLKREIARAGRESAPLVVGFVDIDHFKDFNDTYGHEAGDYVLKQVAGYLRDHTRAGDLVSRYGGEEFVAVWLGADLATAFARAESLREGVEALHLEFRGEPLGAVTLSIGMSLLGEHGDSAEALLSAADGALYEAKGDGRNVVVVAPVPVCELERQALAVAASGLVESRASR
ncbi:MAG: diguanylate cyclase [Coriobacteriia bacterium]|nr:diguanylate cyclase [Coriobacteriia bacterium]